MISFLVDWPSSIISLFSSHPIVSITVALVQATIEFINGNYIGGTIYLIGVIPIPLANQSAKILGRYAGKLIGYGYAPKIVVQFIAKILGNLSRSLKAYKATMLILRLFMAFQSGEISWEQF